MKEEPKTEVCRRWRAGLESREGRHGQGPWKEGAKDLHESVGSCSGDILFIAGRPQMSHPLIQFPHFSVMGTVMSQSG